MGLVGSYCQAPFNSRLLTIGVELVEQLIDFWYLAAFHKRSDVLSPLHLRDLRKSDRGRGGLSRGLSGTDVFDYYCRNEPFRLYLDPTLRKDGIQTRTLSKLRPSTVDKDQGKDGAGCRGTHP